MTDLTVAHCAVCTKQSKVNSYGVCSACAEVLEQEVKQRDSDIRVCQWLHTRDDVYTRQARRIRRYAQQKKLDWSKPIAPIITEEVRRQVYAEHGLLLKRGRPQKQAV